jgi:hypothetical protein
VLIFADVAQFALGLAGMSGAVLAVLLKHCYA